MIELLIVASQIVVGIALCVWVVVSIAILIGFLVNSDWSLTKARLEWLSYAEIKLKKDEDAMFMPDNNFKFVIFVILLAVFAPPIGFFFWITGT